MFVKIGIVYYSENGHTKTLSSAICEGVETVTPSVSLINVANISEQDWQHFLEADGILFGSPTYLGGVAGHFKVFLDETSRRGVWTNELLSGKMASGFTVATYPSGDKLNTLMQLSIYAAQHGMVWFNNTGLGSRVAKDEQNKNKNGFWLGMAATSSRDKTQLIPIEDKLTANKFGRQFAQAVQRWS